MLLNFNSTAVTCQDQLTITSLRRWARQSLAKRLLPDDHRLSVCSRVPVPGTDVKIMRSGDKHHYGGLMRCGLASRCNVCATKIAQCNAAELRTGVANWLSAPDCFLSMMTLTAPHYLGVPLAVTADKLLSAFYTFVNRKTYRRTSKDFEVVGRIRSFESPYGTQNGWHPHFHVLLFSRCLLDLSFSDALRAAWSDSCVSSGLGVPNIHGFDLQDGSAASAYISKWGIEDEMTKSHLKNGLRGSVSPFALLDLYASGAADAGDLFVESARYFKGKRLLLFSKGLRELLGLGPERTDEQIAQAEDQNARLFAMIPIEVWRVILREDMRGELLQVCREGIEAFHLFLYDLYRGFNFYDGYRFK